MANAEFPLTFSCEGDTLIGIVHPGVEDADTAMIVVVGGPQYRAGSHRQFTLLARRISASGIPVMRFDMRGMGDSGGTFPGFEAVAPDIRAAVDALTAAVPTIRRIVLWGLCDGATAIALYARSDRRISGAVLLNPWIRTDATHAQAQIKHYYARRIFSGNFWRRLTGGKVDVRASLRDFIANYATSRQRPGSGPALDRIEPQAPLPDRMRKGLAAFSGRVLLIVSGNDLTALEFVDVTDAAPAWQALLQSGNIERFALPGADHTLSRLEWADAAAEKTASWCRDLSKTQR